MGLDGTPSRRDSEPPLSRSKNRISASEKQLDNLREGKTDKDTVIEDKRKFGDIYFNTREKLDKARGILGNDERKVFEQQLKDVYDERDHKGLEQIQKTISETTDASRGLLDRYTRDLDKNQDLFGKDDNRKVNELKEKKDKFRQSSLEEKQEAAKKLEAELKGLRGIRDNLINIIGDGKGAQAYLKRFGTMTEAEKRAYIEATKKIVEKFGKVSEQLKKADLYDEEELENIAVRFHEAPPDEQAKMLEGFEQDLKTENVKYVQDNFKKFSSERQKKYESKLKKARGLAAKKEVIDGMKDEIRRECIEKFNASRLASPEEKNENAKYIGEEQDPARLEQALAYIPTAETNAKKLEDKFTKFPPKIQAQYDFYLARFSNKGTNSQAPGKQEIVAECEKHMELMAKWDEKLKTFQGNKLLSEGSAAKYAEMFQSLSLKEKEAIIKKSILDDTKQQRINNVTQYEKLKAEHPKLMDKHKEFYSLRLEDRVALVEGIQLEVKERKETTEAYDKKVDEKIESHLLSPKSAKAYKDWFKNLGTVDEMKKMLENSDLDDPRREKVLHVFEKEVPEDTRTKHANTFYNGDLTARIQLLRTLLPDGGTSLDMSLKDMGEAKAHLDELEQKTALKVKLQDASKFEQQKNYRAEYEIRRDIALLDPENEINARRLKILELQYGSVATADMAADGMIHAAIEGSGSMRDRMEASAIFLRMAGAIKGQEELTQHKSFEDRSRLTGSEEDRQLSDEFHKYTDGEMYIDATTGRAKKAMTFRMEEFQNLDRDGIQAKKRMMREEAQLQDVTQRGKRQDIVDRDGRHLEGKELQDKADHLIEDLTASILASQKDAKIDGQAMKQAIARVMKRRMMNENVIKLQDVT